VSFALNFGKNPPVVEAVEGDSSEGGREEEEGVEGGAS